MSWISDVPWKQRILLFLVVAGVIGAIIFSKIIIRDMRSGRATNQQAPEPSMEASMQRVTLSGRDGVNLSQETYFNMGQEGGNVYFLAPAGAEAKVSLSMDSGRGIGLLRVTGKEEAVAFTMEGTVITFKVPDTDCIVEAVGIDAPEGGGIYGAASEYSIDVFGLTEDLLGLFAGKYNKASLVSALGIAMESGKAVKSLTFTGQEAVNESRNGRICLLALINADEARRVLVYFDTASGAFSFATSVEADRELALKNVNKEPLTTPSAVPKPAGEASENESETTALPTEAPAETPTPTEKPAPTDEPERTETPVPIATPMLRTTPKASPTPRSSPTPKAEQVPKKVKKTDAPSFKATADTLAEAFVKK